jgi:hypothetical protein
MKTLTKHKDYYDHCVAQFGYDDSRVYDRRNKVGERIADWETQFLIAIAGKLYPVVKKKGMFFHECSEQLDWRDNEFISSNAGKSTNLNEKYRQPVLIERYVWNPKTWKSEGYKAFIPILSEFGFAARIPAEEMYMTIYNYLGWLKDNPAPPDNQTDKEKTVSHGFDVKRSFRPKMK